MMTIARTLLAAAVLTFTASACIDNESADALRTALDNPSRPETDKARDAGRKPVEVLTFLGISQGDTVMDMIAAGGYYTEVLSNAVGEGGTVYAQNPPFVLEARGGANDKELTQRLAGDRLPNVERIDAGFENLDLPSASLDGAITALNFHDVYNRDPAAAATMLNVMKDLLKPGGVLGVIDHVGVAGVDNASLHRIEKSTVIESAREAGFQVAGESELLANPEDDHTQTVFAEDLRGRTDRFLLKLTKPG